MEIWKQDLNYLFDWFEEVQGREYSFTKDFFAAIDTPYHSFPAPFNAEAVPVYLRLLGKVEHIDGAQQFMSEFLEGLNRRYRHLMSQEEKLSQY